jgi:hypothetical protein
VTRRTRAVDEAGTALVEMIWLGILLMVPMVWILLSVFEVQRGAFGVAAAARSAGRAFSLAPDDATGRRRAEAAAGVALADQGVAGSDWTFHLECGGLPDCHVGGAVVTVRVETQVALPFVPDLLGGGATFALAAVHHLPIGRYQEPGETP